MIKSVATIIRKFSEQLEDEKLSFLPPYGYETLMKIRRPEIKEKPNQKPGGIEPGEEVEVFEDNKWKKIIWPGTKN
jgi:hypothetical protein